MNRIFKFRVWDKGQNRMFWPLSPMTVDNPDDYNFPTVSQEFDTSEFNLPTYCIFPMEHWFSKDCEIQQFTGFKDIKGKEIYERDIIKFYKKYNVFKYNFPLDAKKEEAWTFIKTLEESRNMEVIFDSIDIDEYGRVLGWYVRDWMTDSLINMIERHQISPKDFRHYTIITDVDYQVIGNVFENPKLLKESYEKTK